MAIHVKEMKPKNINCEAKIKEYIRQIESEGKPQKMTGIIVWVGNVWVKEMGCSGWMRTKEMS